MKNYEIRVIPKKDVEGNIYWTAFFPCVKECVGGGNSVEEAIAEAEENLDFYLEYLSNEKKSLPEEYQESTCNGKIALRVAKSTHEKLLNLSRDEGISLNSIICNAIEYYLGKKSYDIDFSKKIEQLQNVAVENNSLQKVNLIGMQGIYNKFNIKIPYGGYDE